VRGNTGEDVAALQRVLTTLHYVPGPVNGTFGYDTQHAVMTFQKLEGLPITGMWTKAERTRSGRATAWHLRYPGSGRAVEIDITRQILVLSEKGVVTLVVDVSTGTEQPYTYKGVSDIAHTPRGRYSIYYKIDGIRVSKLGELYRPNYFYKGWAIHGSASVPNYPASHGCVRITNPNADRLFPLLVKGTTVTLYDE
jgi:N-acetylmuramoyl-L-alanine amidase